ncbi:MULTISPECIES: antifreeze protein [unclassified Marinovum]
MNASIRQALDGWKACLELGTLTVQAQSVIAYRSLGMLGGWSLEKDENQRMVAEKPVAFLEANLAAAKAFFAGNRPEQVTLAWVAPLSDAVGSNLARLEKRGPTVPGALFSNTL